MKTKTIQQRSKRTPRPFINPHVFSLMSVPFPVFVTDRNDKVVPTITLPEFIQLSHYKE